MTYEITTLETIENFIRDTFGCEPYQWEVTYWTAQEHPYQNVVGINLPDDYTIFVIDECGINENGVQFCDEMGISEEDFIEVISELAGDVDPVQVAEATQETREDTRSIDVRDYTDEQLIEMFRPQDDWESEVPDLTAEQARIEFVYRELSSEAHGRLWEYGPETVGKYFGCSYNEAVDAIEGIEALIEEGIL